MTNYIKYELLKIKKQLNFDVSDEHLIAACLAISRVADKKITCAINSYKQKHNLKLSALQKKDLRNSILGVMGEPPSFFKNIISAEDKNKAVMVIQSGLLRNEKKVAGTIKAKIHCNSQENEKYENIIQNEEKGKYQFLLFNVCSKKEGVLDLLKSEISKEYDRLNNYHYMAIVLKDVSWDIVASVAVYCEYFKVEKGFKLYNKHKEEKIEELRVFLKNNRCYDYSKDIENAIEDFFDGVSYGFQFNDLFVSATGDIKILIFQKIELDERVFPCPDCMSTNVRGNSYPKLLQRSFECQNPDCPSRSKIGRGKRYDYFSVKRNLRLSQMSNEVTLNQTLLKNYRKDVFWDNDSIYEMLISFYSFENDNVCIISDEQIEATGLKRKISFEKFKKQHVTYFSDRFTQLFSSLVRGILLKSEPPKRFLVKNDFSLYNGNSSTVLSQIPEKISGVITSPPYYNAREYSQWQNLIAYFVDMAINAKAVYDKMEDDTLYFYNIGDIVGQDNIFISSHMSKKRMMLGFLSIIVFNLVGFNFLDDLIWYKGEVQSKRNSSDKVFPTYMKPVNCYEHILIFSKGIKEISLDQKFFDITPVRKINSKGENTLGHTAPFPEEIVEIIFPYLKKDGYLLDPFLGSGTTVLAALKHGIKAVGIEINDAYYDLSLKRIESALIETHKMQMPFDF